VSLIRGGGIAANRGPFQSCHDDWCLDFGEAGRGPVFAFRLFRSWSLPTLWRGLAHQRTPLLCQVMSVGKVAVGEWSVAVCPAQREQLASVLQRVGAKGGLLDLRAACATARSDVVSPGGARKGSHWTYKTAGVPRSPRSQPTVCLCLTLLKCRTWATGHAGWTGFSSSALTY
jgi:hypothetical protein